MHLINFIGHHILWWNQCISDKYGLITDYGYLVKHHIIYFDFNKE